MFIENYYSQIVLSGVHLVVFIVLRWVMLRLLKRFSKRSEKLEHRTNLIVKHIDYLTIFILIFGLIIIWGIDFRNIGLVMSSIFAVIGIALFAQWSILSNITSGVIMFFTFPYKIGDFIKIHDNEFASEGIIEDIKTFHVIIKTMEGELITYPNSLMLQKGVTVVKPEELDEYLIEEENKNVKEEPID